MTPRQTRQPGLLPAVSTGPFLEAISRHYGSFMWMQPASGGTMARPGRRRRAIALLRTSRRRDRLGAESRPRGHRGRHEIVRHAADRRPAASWPAPPVRCRAQTAQSTEPIEVAKLPYIEIFSPTFFWNDEADFVRTGSTTCPKGRAITGGLSIQQGKASLRILESYPDGESWVMRVVNRQKPDNVQSLQVRGFALCLLPAARKASVLTDAADQAAARVEPVRAAGGLRQHDRPPGLPAGRARRLRRLRARPGVPRAGGAAPGAELSRSERLERPGGQRRARVGPGRRRAHLRGLPRHQGGRRHPRLPERVFRRART